MQTRNCTQDSLIRHRHLKSSDVNLLGATENFFHLVGDNRSLIAGYDELGGRFGVEECVMERVDREP